MSVENSVQPKGRSPRTARPFAIMILTFILLIGASTAVFAGKSTIGDFVWIDYNQDGLANDGPTGINGVEIRVYKDNGDTTFSPVLDLPVVISTTVNQPINTTASNTAPGEPGWYDTPVDNGLYWVLVPASNFATNGPLQGYTYTGNPADIQIDGSILIFRNVPIQGDINDADFPFVPLDWGDLPDGVSPTSPDYNTDSTGPVGASHVITPGLSIGAEIDAETDGQPNATATGDDSARTPDDEDGITLPPMFVAGSSATITATIVNTYAGSATFYGFMDWNGDGDFGDTGETATVLVPTTGPAGSVVNLNFSVPVTADLSQDLGARFRLSSDATLSANGPAPDGEVEDYLIQVTGYDWGDLPDGVSPTSPDYHTDSTGAIVGPSHAITSNLRLGAVVDADVNGQPDGTATGDDTVLTPDDEDGVAIFPQFVAGSSSMISFNAVNNTGSAATLYGFIDWNADGDFGDTGEQVSVNVPNNTNGAIGLNVTVPLTASLTSDLGARFRLSTDSGLGAYGPASDGEVEDYLVDVEHFDLALRKVQSSPVGGVLPGGFVTYTITISNQGTIDATDIVVSDYITAGFTFTPNNGWIGAAPTISTTIASLPAGTSTTRILVLQVASNYYGSQLTNYAEISSADDDNNPNTVPPTDVDSTPDTDNTNDGTPKDDVTSENHKANPANDEDDHDPAVTPVTHIRDLAIEKTATVVEARPGDLVTFTIVITNLGTLPASNIQVTDTFTNALLVPVPAHPTNTAAGWSGAASPLVTTVAGPLNPGQTTTLQVVLRIDPAYRGALLTNVATVPPDDNPPNDRDPAPVPVRYFDLAMRKLATPSTTVEPGKTVTFTIEIYNQGTLPAYNIQVSDQFTSALTFTPSVGLNAGWSVVSATELNKIIAGPLAAGAMTTTQLVLQVPSTYTTTGIVTNTAEISSVDDDTNPANTPPTDVDSTPDTNPTNDPTIDNNTNPFTDIPGDEDDADPAPVLVTYNPTAVQIAKSAVQKVARGNEVSWTTESESELLGFNLYRVVNGQLQKVNSSMITAQKPGQADGASYSVVDSAASGANIAYVLEIFSSNGDVGTVYLGSNAQAVKLFVPVILFKK